MEGICGCGGSLEAWTVKALVLDRGLYFQTLQQQKQTTTHNSIIMNQQQMKHGRHNHNTTSFIQRLDNLTFIQTFKNRMMLNSCSLLVFVLLDVRWFSSCICFSLCALSSVMKFFQNFSGELMNLSSLFSILLRGMYSVVIQISSFC